MTSETAFHAPISEEIWGKKYRFLNKFTGEIFDQTVEDTWLRIAEALAEPETQIPDHVNRSDSLDAKTFWAQEFYDALKDFKFLPAGRIIAGAGTDRRVTLFNCYVMGTIPDSMDGIFQSLREAALTMQQGGGIGYDFSTLRPKGAQVKQVAADASGPLTFMDVWDSMCKTVMSAGSRRGAMMATMRCDHPDIEAFIEAKADPARLRMFNMSVLVTDEFMEAVERVQKNGGGVRGPDEMWPLTFNGQVYKEVNPMDLWDKIMQSTYDYAEPGVIFIDRINNDNNLSYMETISATNPCGEQPLPPYGACLLGSINLAALVENAYEGNAGVDSHQLKKLVSTAVRMMDNVNDVSLFPLEEQLAEAQAKRRIGLGVTGLADALLMCGIRYGSDEAAERAEKWMQMIALEAYKASIALAREKGPFPALKRADYLNGDNFAARNLPGSMKAEIMEVGIRNSHLLSIAPTGTISLYAGNISSGVEPIFAPSFTRKTLQDDGSKKEQRVVDYAVDKWEKSCDRLYGGEPLPPAYVDAQSLAPAEHVKMQAAVQKWVDTSISKTVNVPEDISFEGFKAVYWDAFKSGCKGCTTYRPNDVTGSVIEVEKPKEAPQELTPLTDELLMGEARLFMNGGSANKDLLRAKLAEFGVDKVKDLTGPKRIDDAHKLYHWLGEKMSPEGVDRTVSENSRNKEATVDSILASTPDPTARDVLTPRPEALRGTTYKVKVGDIKSVYLTISDIEENGTVRPFEIFLRSSDPTHDEWMTTLARMISAILRRPFPADFVPDELMRVHSARTGGFWRGHGFQPSLVAAIGRKLKDHMGELKGGVTEVRDYALPEDGNPAFSEWSKNAGVTDPDGSAHKQAVQTLKACCPKCFSSNLKNESGCLTCLECGHSKCG